MAESKNGLYVYCVLPTTAACPVEDMDGVAPDTGVEKLTEGDLTALVTRVPFEEFGSDALKRNLENLPWLERTAFAHDAVLARALGAEAVVPFRLCTIFAGEDRVREMLVAERDMLRDALARLARRAEWSIKMLIDSRRLEETLRRRSRSHVGVGASDGDDAAPGHAFFERKKLAQRSREHARSMARATAAETDERLRNHSKARKLLPPLRRELSREPGEMVLNAAYLVDRGEEDTFATLARELAKQHEDMGIRLTVSGPWAPYNFVSIQKDPK
jgi:Gas vesicle synthesis protein GvpL/GvpF